MINKKLEQVNRNRLFIESEMFFLLFYSKVKHESVAYSAIVSVRLLKKNLYSFTD